MQVIGTAQELDRYTETISLIDEVFIYGRGRKISLAHRFPNAYGPENKSNIHCLVFEDIVVSAVVVQKFDFLNIQNTLTGYMIGGVVTRPKYYKKGFASRLLSEVENVLQDADILVLWTGIPKFYFKFGWQQGKRGLFGRLSPHKSNYLADNYLFNERAQSQADLNKIELYRIQQKLKKIDYGNHSRYSNLPIPVEKCDVWMVLNQNNELEAYCVVGSTESIGYIFEQEGSTQAIQIQLDYLRNVYPEIYFNADNMQYEVYKTAGALEINSGSFELFKNKSLTIKDNVLKQYYFPYLDRI